MKSYRWAFIHTWRERTDCKTKKLAEELLKAWKDEHEGLGWEISGSMTSGYFARLPDCDWLEEQARCRRGEEPVRVRYAGIREAKDVSFPATDPSIEA